MSHRVNSLRRLSFAVATAATLALCTACGSSSAGGGSTGDDSTEKIDYIGPGPESPEAAALAKTAGIVDDTDWCGDKEITVGVADGIGLNAWSQASYATVRSELAKCPNVKTIVTQGGGDVSKAIADINSLVSQGVAAIVLIPDFGEAQLPAIKAATAAGVQVVNWGIDPGGVPGEDYVTYVDEVTEASGEAWANFVAEELGGKGNVVYLGGPAGNAVSAKYLQGIAKVAGENPGLNILTGLDTWPDTKWDPALAQQVMASLIAKYPKIDAVISDESGSGAAATRALVAAGRDLPVVATIESNELGCLREDIVKSGKEFDVVTTSSRNWLGRIAARKAVAAAQGVPEDSPSRYLLDIYEDSTSGNPPKCDPSLSPTTYFSNQISPEDMEKYGKSS